MTLNDPVKEEWYSFHDGGTVSATYGEKKGWITFPTYSWRIRNGMLQIVDNDKKVFQELRLVNRDRNSITVVNNAGKTVQFLVLSKDR